MQLQLQTFSSLVANAAAAVQGAARQLIDLSVGSILRSVLEANAALALWLQWLILQVLRTTRAATSQAGDLDTWMADFGLARFGAVSAGGVLTFSRFSPVAAGFIAVGATARTNDGTQTYVVIPDFSNPAWSAAQGGFVLPAGTASLNVAASALTAGAAGNVQPGAIGLLASAIPGIDTVTNAAAFQGGIDGESDAAFRERFKLYLPSLARSTRLAIAYAIESVQQGLLYSIVENQLPSFAPQPGFFTITVDNGTGYPPAPLLAAVTAAVDAMRPIGSQFVVQAPTVQAVNISLAITVGGGTSHAITASNVAVVLTNFLNSFSLGAPLTWTRIAQVAYSADGNVSNVTNILLNGGTADLIPLPNVVLKAGAIAVA